MGHLIINFVGGNYVDLPFTKVDAEKVIAAWHMGPTHTYQLNSDFAFRGVQVAYMTWKAAAPAK